MQGARSILALVALAACQPALADEPPPARLEHHSVVRFHMHENFDLIRAIERLLVRGRLDAARPLAEGIARAPDEPGMTAFAAQTSLVRERAAAVASAPDVDEALRREARLAAACAGCHVAAGVLPELRTPPPAPPDRPTIEARMARHLWASDRMWEGVVIGLDEPWRVGLDVLAATPLPAAASDATRARLARQLQRLARTARRLPASEDMDARARQYGEILVTCAACHTAPLRAR